MTETELSHATASALSPLGAYETTPFTSDEVTKATQQGERATARKLELAWRKLRDKRDVLLAATDYIVSAPDAPDMTDEKKAAVLAYRQELRDLPSNTADPNYPTWPTPPE